MLNGRRVDVRHLELAPIAVDDEASKKSVSMVYYGNHNYEVAHTKDNGLKYIDSSFGAGRDG